MPGLEENYKGGETNMENLSQEGFTTLEDYQKANQGQLTLFDMQDLAVKKTVTLAQLQEQLKKANEMFNDAFKNEPSFRERESRVKQESSSLNEVKLQIKRQPSLIALETKMKEIKNEIKEKKEEVSNFALEVYRQTGNNEFEKDGETYEIKTVAKLVKRA